MKPLKRTFLSNAFSEFFRRLENHKERSSLFPLCRLCGKGSFMKIGNTYAGGTKQTYSKAPVNLIK